jgi:hypothetical protein
MSITSAKTGSTSLSLALENNFMEPIASTLVGAGGSSVIEFADIPQGYKHLQIRGIAKTTRSGGSNYANDLNINFNSDYSNNYSAHGMYAFGGMYAYGIADYNAILIQSASADGDGVIPNIFGSFVMDILDYSSNVKFKTFKCLGGTITTSSYVDIVAFNSGNWRSSNPIENIKIRASFNLKQNTRFSLYGIKG